MDQRPKAVILNDTSTRYHHGCARVMRLLCEGLEAQGMVITAKSPARHDWANDPEFLKAVQDADVIVINGEGTLHHGKPAGAALLAIADHPARGQTPLALINALYQDNPDDWHQWLAKFDLISARDSDSAAALSHASGKPVRWLPDLSLSSPVAVNNTQRSGVIVGDSVKLSARKILARAAMKIPNVRFIPTKTLGGKIWTWRMARSLLYRVYNAAFFTTPPRFEMPRDEQSYLAEVAKVDLHITGRFHAVCLSMLVETPFLTLTSNASKIERLLNDAGLGASRIVSAQKLETPPHAAPFTPQERTAIRRFRAMAQKDAVQLFADIATLAKRGRA